MVFSSTSYNYSLGLGHLVNKVSQRHGSHLIVLYSTQLPNQVHLPQFSLLPSPLLSGEFKLLELLTWTLEIALHPPPFPKSHDTSSPLSALCLRFY